MSGPALLATHYCGRQPDILPGPPQAHGRPGQGRVSESNRDLRRRRGSLRSDSPPPDGSPTTDSEIPSGPGRVRAAGIRNEHRASAGPRPSGWGLFRDPAAPDTARFIPAGAEPVPGLLAPLPRGRCRALPPPWRGRAGAR